MKIIIHISLLLTLFPLNTHIYSMEQPFHCDSCKMLYAAENGNLSLINKLFTGNQGLIEATCPTFTTRKNEETEEISGSLTEEHVNSEINDTPLLTAIRHSQTAAIELLLTYNANIWATNSKAKTILHLVKDQETLQLLIKKIKLQTKPLTFAMHPRLGAQSPAQSLVSLVIQNIAQFTDESIIHNVDSEGTSSLCQAAKTGTAAMIATLIQAGANVDTADSKGLTPLHYAAGRTDHEAIEIAKQLVTHGASITASADGMRNALFFARYNGDSEQKMLHYLESVS